MSRVIAIANQKGGVGKTTTAINLGASLAAAERRTLVIDVDAQGNTTSGLGLSTELQRGLLYDVLLDQVPLSRAISPRVHLPMLDVVPTDQNLAGAEVELVNLPQWQFRLRSAIAEVLHLYDYILMDCPPALGVLTLNALAAADSVIIPLQTEYYALEGLVQITDNIRIVRDRLNPGLSLEGILLTMYDARLNLAREVEQQARAEFGGRVFRTTIPRNVTLAEAPSYGEPALKYAILSAGARSYLALARELLEAEASHTPHRAAG